MTILDTRLPFAALLLLACASSPALAQEPNEAEARALFETGVVAFDEGRHEDALVAFEHSYALRPTPLVLYNIAVAERALGRTADAIRHLRQYIAEADPTDPRREVILSELEELGAAPDENEPPPVREPPPPREPDLVPPPAETARAAPEEPSPPPERVAPPPARRPERDGGSILESPWLYLVTAAILLGGGAAAFLLLYDPPEEVDGNFDPPVVIALE